MKKLIIAVICAVMCGAAMAHSVAFNTNTHIYHDHSCIWAKRCTKNCITVDSSEAKRHGGRPCKVCGG